MNSQSKHQLHVVATSFLGFLKSWRSAVLDRIACGKARASPTVQVGSTKKSPATLRQKFYVLLGVLLDGFTITVSIADIATDVFVLLDFFRGGHRTFFQASLAIFILSQSSYAFLFVATFGSHLRPFGRTIAFLSVLPFAQLVPLFTWFENLHLQAIDRALLRMHLIPTSAGKSSATSASGDSMWDFLQSKYQSHAGFLVEAFVEAVPQSILQTVFAVANRHSSSLNNLSVAISIFTIASKGYLVSYALDVVTFAFNFICIITDCIGLFASATILASHGVHSFSAQMLVVLVGSGLVLSTAGGFGLLWFANLDDHLKLRKPFIWKCGVRGVSRGSLVFDLYIQRMLAWFLAIVPCVVTFTGARLALLPICVFKSIDPDLVCHAPFFRCLSHFLRGSCGGDPDRDARFWTANLFIARARSSVGQLTSIRHSLTLQEKSGRIRKWAADVGSGQRQAVYQSQQNNNSFLLHSVEDNAMQQAIFESLVEANQTTNTSAAAALMRSRLRRLKVISWIERTTRSIIEHLNARSDVFRTGCSRTSLCMELRKSPLNVMLRVWAIGALIWTFLCAVPLLISHSMYMVIGIAFPLFFIVGDENACFGSELYWYLAMLYSVMLLLVVILSPFVAQSQFLWMDLADLHGFPDSFYHPAVVSEIRKRHLRDSFLRQRLGHRLSQHTLGFLEQ